MQVILFIVTIKSLYFVLDSKGQLMLVTELAPLGALCDYLPDNKVCVNCPKLL